MTTASQLSTPIKSRFSTIITKANVQTTTVSSLHNLFLYQPTPCFSSNGPKTAASFIIILSLLNKPFHCQNYIVSNNGWGKMLEADVVYSKVLSQHEPRRNDGE